MKLVWSFFDVYVEHTVPKDCLQSFFQNHMNWYSGAELEGGWQGPWPPLGF